MAIGDTAVDKSRKAPVQSKSLDKANKKGVLYIGHLPDGFEEGEIKKYFTQFGKILRLRLSRSPKSGKCKGYGFIQFADEDVAKIAAQTMNNYIMFRRRLEVRLMEPSEVHSQLFRGWNRRFKTSTVPSEKRTEYNSAIGCNSHTLRKKKKKEQFRQELLQKLGYKVPSAVRNITSKEPKRQIIQERVSTEPITQQNTPKASLVDSPKQPALENTPLVHKVDVAKTVGTIEDKLDTERDLSVIPPPDAKVKKTKFGKSPVPKRCSNDSDDEISFKTPPNFPGTKSFRKTPLPKQRLSEDTDEFSTPPQSFSSKKQENQEAPVRSSPGAATEGLKASLTPDALKKKSKISPRFTRSAAKKRQP